MKREKNTDLTTDKAELPPEDTASFSQLTAKNSDYIHSVTKQLILAGKTDADVKAVLADIIPQILEAQKDGKTARTLLGTPTDFVSQQQNAVSADKKKGNTNTNPWLMWLDSALLIFSLLAVLSGFMSYFEKGITPYRLATLIFSSVTGGLAMYIVYHVSANPKKKVRKYPRLFYISSTVGAMLLWLLVTLATTLAPLSINPAISGSTLIVAGIVTFSVRYWLKTQFNIQSSMTSFAAQPQRRPQKK